MNEVGDIPDAKNSWQTFFDAHAPDYESNVFTKNTLAEVGFVLEELALESGASILDVGCGTGRHPVELARRGFRVTGIDLSAGMLDEARKAAGRAGVHVDFQQADATRFSFEALYDGAICLCEGAFGLLGHGDNAIEQPLTILRNIRAALRPGARAVFTVLNGYAMARRRSQADVESGRFDPIALAEHTEVGPEQGLPPLDAREKGFTPPELMLLFRVAELETLHIWGGAAGNWRRGPIELDEMEIMAVARRPD